MILVWNGEAIEAIDMDKVFPGPRAEEVARLLEPGYLRGYLEGRKAVVGKKEIREKGRVGKGLRQIQRLINQPIAEPKMAAPWRYAMFLKEMILEKSPSAKPQLVDAVVPQPEVPQAVDAVVPQTADAVVPQPVDEVVPQPVDVETALPVDAATQPTGAEGGVHAPTDGKSRGKAKRRRRRKAKRNHSPERQPDPKGGEQQPTSPKDGERPPNPRNGEQPPNPKPPTSPEDEAQPTSPEDEAQPTLRDGEQPSSAEQHNGGKDEAPPAVSNGAKRKRRRRKAKHTDPTRDLIPKDGEKPAQEDGIHLTPRDEAQTSSRDEVQPSDRKVEASPAKKRKRRRGKVKRRTPMEFSPKDEAQHPDQMAGSVAASENRRGVRQKRRCNRARDHPHPGWQARDQDKPTDRTPR